MSTEIQRIASGGVPRAWKYFDSTGDITRIDLFPDASITDYGDVSTTGTIAWALAQITTSGVVHLYPGTYVATTSISLGETKSITGEGSNSTIIDASTASADINVVSIDGHYAGISGASIKIPSALSGSGIRVYGGGGVEPYAPWLKDIYIYNAPGASAGTGYAVYVQDSYQFILSQIRVSTYCNGVKIANLNGANNIGDGSVRDVDIALIGNDTYGLYISGASASTKVVNNIEFSRVEITKGGSATGTTGIYLDNVTRLTFNNIDLENIATGVSFNNTSLSSTGVSRIVWNNLYILNSTTADMTETTAGGTTYVCKNITFNGGNFSRAFSPSGAKYLFNWDGEVSRRRDLAMTTNRYQWSINDDFVGVGVNPIWSASSTDGGHNWALQNVANGIYRGTTHSDNGDNVLITFGGNRPIERTYGAVFEARVQRVTASTSYKFYAGFFDGALVLGTNHIAAIGLDRSASQTTYRDITSNATGSTVTDTSITHSSAMRVIRVELDGANVRFFIFSDSGTLLWSSGNITATLPGSTTQLEPFVYLETQGGTGSMVLDVDYIVVEGGRIQ